MAANMTRPELLAEARPSIEELKEAVKRAAISFAGASRNSLGTPRKPWANVCAAIDALAANQAEGWQPIETAPKELGFAFLGNADEGWTEQGWWDGERSEWWPLNCHHTDSFGQALNATHWMPLPAAPPIPSNGGAGEAL